MATFDIFPIADCNVYVKYWFYVCLTLITTLFIIRTKALVLELLAAVCLVRGGHEIILSAFDHFKTVIYWIKSHSILNPCKHLYSGVGAHTQQSGALSHCELTQVSWSQVCSESMRFEKLMEHFKNEDDNIDFLVGHFTSTIHIKDENTVKL